MSEQDDWDNLTPKQQKAALAKFRAANNAVQRHIKDQMAEMAAFVRMNPSAVIKCSGETSSQPGLICSYVFHIEVDAERFERYQAERRARRG